MHSAIMRGTPGYRRDKTALKNRSPARKVPCCAFCSCAGAIHLSTEEIARHLTRSGKHTVSPSSVPGYIGRLPQQDRPGPHTEHGGLLLNHR